MCIKQKSCNENTFEVQLMKNKEGDNIGKFFKLNTNSYNYRKLKKNFYISKTYKKLYYTGNKIQKNYTKNNIMKEKQNDAEITNKEQNFNVKYLGDIDNKSEFSKNFNLRLNKQIPQFSKKNINLIYINIKKENELNDKINNLEKINEENKKIIEAKENNEIELRNQISDLNKIIKENNETYLNKEKEYKEKILKLEKQIEENDIKKRKNIEKINLLNLSKNNEIDSLKKIIEEKCNKEKEYNTQIEKLLNIRKIKDDEINNFKLKISLFEKNENKYENKINKERSIDLNKSLYIQKSEKVISTKLVKKKFINRNKSNLIKKNENLKELSLNNENANTENKKEVEFKKAEATTLIENIKKNQLRNNDISNLKDYNNENENINNFNNNNQGKNKSIYNLMNQYNQKENNDDIKSFNSTNLTNANNNNNKSPDPFSNNNINNLGNDFNNNNNKVNSDGNINNNQIPPPLVGLNNIGSPCYMNSILQCLSQTLPLTNYFLEKDNQKYFNYNNMLINNNDMNIKLAPVYLDLIKQLWINKDGHTSYRPSKFKDTIEKMNPIFQNNQVRYIKDFIIFVLEKLHKELNNPIMDFQYNSFNQNLIINENSKENVFVYFIKNYKNEYSKISDIFFGIKETTNICLNCQNIYNSQNLDNLTYYNYELFNCLIFPLEEIKSDVDMSYSYNKNSIMNNNVVSIYECFEYNQKTETIKGQNRRICPLCQHSDFKFCSKIFYGPNILIIIINREKDNINNVKLDFQENIDISNYILDKDMNKMIYNLYGVISHIGESGSSGHFIASCKSFIDNNWYRFKDTILSQIYNIQNDVIEYGTPFILFYKKQKYNENIFDKYKIN